MINLDPDKVIPTSKVALCVVHQSDPRALFPNCACITSFGVRLASPEEYRERRRTRLLERRTWLLSELQELESDLKGLER